METKNPLNSSACIIKTKILQLFSRKLLFITGLMILFSWQSTLAQYTDMNQQEEQEDKTESPYFFVQAKDSATDRLPLKETAAEVNISGVIADVTVQQTYCNEGENVLEAIYVFPSSTRAAVYYMHMTIGKRILYAKIEEKQKAREQYEEAKEQGQTASLLEQERPNVFKMNVANIMPGDTINIVMKYTELLVPTEGIYEFVYPTVVGPRYVSPSEDSSETAFAGNPYTHEGEAPLYDFHIDVNINAGLPVQSIECPSHDSTETGSQGNTAKCTLLSKKEGNRDFILQYRLSGNDLESGLLLYEGEEENFFLAMIQPPKEPTDVFIPPREYIFIMDVSGSMYGFPLSVSKKLLEDLIGNLRPTDRFNLMFFAGGSSVMAENSIPANHENIEMAIDMIDNKTGGGGTNLLPALERALDMEGTEDYSRSFVIATDGYVTVEKQAFDLIRNNLGNANFFPFGIGSSSNRYIIEGMANVGMTEPLIVTDQGEANEKAEKFRKYIEYPVLTNIDVNFEDFEVYDVEPLSVPDVLAERPIIIYGKWKGNPSGAIRLTGKTGNQLYDETIPVNEFAPDTSNIALKYLWARKRIQLLDDYTKLNRYNADSTIVKEITQLGLQYNLLTKYTSFIAIDSLIRNEGDSITTVEQPLPLPEGVSEYAVGDGRYNGSTSVPTFSANTEAADHAKVNTLAIKENKQGSPNILRGYPNPFSNKITLTIILSDEDAEKVNWLEIYNINGQLIDKIRLTQLTSGENELELHFAQKYPALQSGMYYARLKVGNKYVSTHELNYIRR